MSAGYGGSNCLTLQIAGPDLIRGVGYDLIGKQNALVDQAPDEVMSNANQFGSFGHRQPLAILFGRTIGMDTMLAPHRAYALRIPRHTLPCTHAHTIERCSYVLVGPPAGHTSNHSKRLLGSAAAMFACFWLAYPQFGVLPSLPMNRQNDFTRLLIHVSDDVSNQGSHKLLACARGYPYCIRTICVLYPYYSRTQLRTSTGAHFYNPSRRFRTFSGLCPDLVHPPQCSRSLLHEFHQLGSRASV